MTNRPARKRRTAKAAPVRRLIVRRKPAGQPCDGLMLIEGNAFPCRLGKNGISAFKREGDWKTPLGCFRLKRGYFRTDRLRRIATALPIAEIGKQDGWCDAPTDPNYNRRVKLPYAASAETMYRDDGLYDVVIVMDHNDTRRGRNLGSAVFLHLTAKKPWTAGCVAIAPSLMRKLLPRLSTRTVVDIRR